jgi:hypothetical protein
MRSMTDPKVSGGVQVRVVLCYSPVLSETGRQQHSGYDVAAVGPVFGCLNSGQHISLHTQHTVVLCYDLSRDIDKLHSAIQYQGQRSDDLVRTVTPSKGRISLF